MSTKRENDIVTVVVYGTFGAMWATVAAVTLLKWWIG